MKSQSWRNELVYYGACCWWAWTIFKWIQCFQEIWKACVYNVRGQWMNACGLFHWLIPFDTVGCALNSNGHSTRHTSCHSYNFPPMYLVSLCHCIERWPSQSISKTKVVRLVMLEKCASQLMHNKAEFFMHHFTWTTPIS